MGLTIDLDAIARLELAAPLGLLKTIDPHFAALNALLGLTAGECQSLPFEELIQTNRLGAFACGGGTWRWGQKKR